MAYSIDLSERVALVTGASGAQRAARRLTIEPPGRSQGESHRSALRVG